MLMTTTLKIMIKFIIPVVLIFLTVLFWEKITEFFQEKFNIRLNYIVVSAVIIAITIILLLLNF
jgi:hypothetical protein